MEMETEPMYTGRCSVCGYEVPDEGTREYVKTSLERHEKEAHPDICEDLAHFFQGYSYSNVLYDPEKDGNDDGESCWIDCKLCGMRGQVFGEEEGLYRAKEAMDNHLESLHPHIPGEMLLRKWDTDRDVFSVEWLSSTYGWRCSLCGKTGVMESEEEVEEGMWDHMKTCHPYVFYFKSDFVWHERLYIGPESDGTETPEKNFYGEKFDPVDVPQHYASGSLECKDWIRAMLTVEEYRGWLKGNALKYIWRYEDKGKPIQDISKARKYLEFLIDDLEREQTDIEEGTVWTV